MHTLTVTETISESQDENGNRLTPQQVLERVIFNTGPVQTESYSANVFWTSAKTKKECIARWESFAENTNFYNVGRIGELEYVWGK